MRTELKPMTPVVRRKANFLPMRSPYLPNKAPPRGLTAAPATNAPREGRTAGIIPWPGKNTAERTMTSEP